MKKTLAVVLAVLMALALITARGKTQGEGKMERAPRDGYKYKEHYISTDYDS